MQASGESGEAASGEGAQVGAVVAAPQEATPYRLVVRESSRREPVREPAPE
jgi:hypothetical protein